MHKMGTLEIITGPMYSGKTEELIKRIRRAQIAKKSVLVIKNILDTRYKKRNLASHSKQTIKSIVVKNATDILKKNKPQIQIIAIDEAMWFGKSLIPVVDNLIKSGKRVIVTGLSTTYTKEPFEPIPHLMAIADRVDKLSAICSHCGKDAIFHKKIIAEKQNPFSITVKNVGEHDKYEARCRNCFDLL